jgi:ABC-type transport system substrate-binding protein
MAFNVSKAPYSDPRVLKALSKGWDRDAFGKQTYGEGKYNILGPYSWVGWFDKSPDLGDAYKFDPNAAKQLLSAAGVSNLTIPFDYFPYSQTMDDTIQYWAQQMKQNLGVTINLNKMEYNTYQTKYFAGQLENGTSGFVATFPRYAPISIRLLWKSTSSRNVYHINDPKMDSAIDKLTTTTDKNEQKSAFQDFWNQLMGTPYIEQMVEGQTFFVWKKNVHNWLFNMYHDWGGWGYQAMERLWMDA